MSCSELHPHPATQPENREKQDGKQERSEWASETTGTPPWVLMFVFWVPAGEEEPGDAKMLGEIVSISTNKHKPSGLKQHHSLSSCLQVRSRLSPGARGLAGGSAGSDRAVLSQEAQASSWWHMVSVAVGPRSLSLWGVTGVFPAWGASCIPPPVHLSQQ